MSDEEKKAIERIDYIQDFIIENGQYDADVNDMGYFSRILNLIEKQSKEIEELKEDDKHQWEERCKLTFELENSTPNDKIKAKIGRIEDLHLSEDYKDYVISVLQSLLKGE